MKQKGNVAVISILVALVALMILILSISYIIIAQPAKDADVKNIIYPFDQFQNSGSTPDFITYTNVDNNNNNEDPTISVPDITITFGETYNIDLDSYSSDEEDSHSDLDFDITYTPTFTPAPITLSFNDATNVLSITEVNGSWTGTQAITIEVKDTDDNTDKDSFTVTISANNSLVPGAPVINEFPDIVFEEQGTDSTHDLDDYVNDSDNLDSELIWSVTGNVNVNVNIDNNTHIISFDTNNLPEWSGSEYMILRVEDPDGNYDEEQILVTVTQVDDDATWINTLSNKNFDEDSATGIVVYDNITGECSDVDSNEIITVLPNTGFNLTLSGINLVLSNLEANWYGTETVYVYCNGIQSSFTLTVNELFDDCIIIHTDAFDKLYCD